MRTSTLSVAGLLFLLSPTVAAQATWTSLGTGSAWDMSDDGQFVVGENGGSAFLWSSGGGQASIGQDDAVGVSSDGTVVFGNATDSGGNTVAARWTQAGGWTLLGGIGGQSGSSVSTAYGMSADGNVGTGLGWVNAGTAGAFSWTPGGGMTQLPQQGPNSSRGNAVSSDGTHIGGWDEAGNGSRRAVFWDSNQVQTFTCVTPTNTDGAGEVWGFSSDNVFVVGGTEGEGFVWDAVNGMTKTGGLPSNDLFKTGEARGVSDDGEKVVGWYRVTFPFDTRATIWTPGSGIEELKGYLEARGATGVPSLTFAATISADGRRVLCNFQGGWGIADLGPDVGPGTAYCFCEAAGPCGNNGTAESGCANSAGPGAIVTSGGSASVGADDLTFLATGLPVNKPSLLFSGTAPGNSILGDGLLCVGGTIQRHDVFFSDGAGTAAYGPGLAAAWGWNPGDTRFFSVWYRDPGGPCNSGYNLANGIRINHLP